MHIFGSVSDNGKVFSFENDPRSDNTHSLNNNFIHSDNKIFIYIDGNISKLSDEIIELTSKYHSISQKISYLHYIGFNFENHICGSFNIFLFDHSSKEFRLIRDSRGTKSIYYANNGSKLIFSSDQSLIINSIKNVTLNRRKLIQFLNMDYVSNKQTYFQEIFRVPPSHCLIYKNNISILKKYNLSKTLFKNEKNHDPTEGFKKHFLNSVASFARKDKKIGVMMSGGLDSSAITVALKENNINQVYTYSANFDHIKDNENLHETKYQKNVSEYTSYSHTVLQMEGKSPIKPIKKFTKILNQPLNVPNLYMFEEIANKLVNDRIDIILDGNDGDTTVSHGFEALFFYIRNLKLIKFTKETYLYSKYKKTSFPRMMRILIRQAIKEILNIKSENKSTMLNEGLLIRKNPKNNITYFSSHEQKLSNELHFWGNEFRNSFFRNFGINNYSPFYDEELINFCLNMPLKNKLHNGYTRKVLRDFLAEYLPKEHAKRDKSILTSGLLRNFTLSDLEIVKNEYSNANQTLLKLIDKDRLEEIIINLENEKEINEKELIILQMFVSANTFLNVYKF